MNKYKIVTARPATKYKIPPTYMERESTAPLRPADQSPLVQQYQRESAVSGDDAMWTERLITAAMA
jgi:hypothetical protein